MKTRSVSPAITTFALVIFLLLRPELLDALQQEGEQTQTSAQQEEGNIFEEDPFGGNPNPPIPSEPDEADDEDEPMTGDPQLPGGPRANRPNESDQGQGGEEEEWVPPEAEVVTLDTSDRVILQADYYAGKPGKTTAPVILLHDFDGSREDMRFLALHLQSLGHAVIAPDIRGHGASTMVQGIDDPIDRSRFRAVEIMSIKVDIERCKKYLMTRNNAGELNIELLTVVSVGCSAIPAVNWCVDDWFLYPAFVNGRKQGQDVKAIAMIGPIRRFKSAALTQTIRSPLFTGDDLERPLAVQLAWASDDGEQAREGEAIQSSLERSRRRLEKKYMKTIRPYETGMSATELVAGAEHEVIFQDVADFIEMAVLRRADSLPWQNRARPDE
ncbi:MAG: hypothetical protein AAF456_14210 [Planctomycetota bacterium]